MAAGQTFASEFAAYFDKMKAFSDARTDEVGYTKTEFKSKGPRKK